MNINFSFIIPHHNSPELLSRCLNSIPQRSDIEIIVVDDNSNPEKRPDVTRADARVIYIPSAESKGAGHARNVGLDNAKGKWLLFADCDDYYSEQLLPVIDKYKNAEIDILYFNVNCSYISGNTITPIQRDLKGTLLEFEDSKKTIRDIQRLGLLYNEVWSKMYNREFIHRIGARFEEIPKTNDAWFVNYAGSQAQNIAVSLEKLYNYIILDTGISKKKRPKRDYYLSMKSTKRRNYLKWECKCYDTIKLPGFNKENVLRDFGRLTFVQFYMYKIFTDKTILPMMLRRFYLKFKHTN